MIVGVGLALGDALAVDFAVLLGLALGESPDDGLSLLQASLHMLNDMKTFGEAQVHVAEDGPGALVQTSEVRD